MSLFISTAYSIGSFLDERLDEPADDQGGGLGFAEAAALQVEELLLADLGDARLVADLDVILIDFDIRIRVGTALRDRESRRRTRRSTSSPSPRRSP